LRDLPLLDVFSQINRRLAGRINVKIVFFSNMCHSGVLPKGTMSATEQLAMDAFREQSERYTKGVEGLAYIPAVPGDQLTYEKDEGSIRGSVFAHYLVEGLKGAAADERGAVTSGSILSYLQKKLSPPLLATSSFAADITLGFTRE